MKRVVALNSGRRKGNTYRLLDQIKETLKYKGIDMDIINLSDYDIKNCIGCERCIYQDDCVLVDDVNKIMRKLSSADGLIIASPVYMLGITGKLKTFADRTCKWYHRPDLVGKPVILVSTTQASGLKKTLGYLDDLAIQWGLHPCGKIGKKEIKNSEITPKQLDRFIHYIKRGKHVHNPSVKQIISFQVQKVLAMKVLTVDTDFWVQRGWDKQTYFYDCKINPVKKWIGQRFYKLLYQKIKKQDDLGG